MQRSHHRNAVGRHEQSENNKKPRESPRRYKIEFKKKDV